LTANPRTSRAVSADPREPATVEKRTKTGERRIRQHLRHGQVGQRLVHLKEPMRRRAARVDDSLGDPLVIEMLDLLPHHEIFKQRRSAFAGLKGVLVRADRLTSIGREWQNIGGCREGQMLVFGRQRRLGRRLRGHVVLGHRRGDIAVRGFFAHNCIPLK
jgi:hypothetical protein